MSSRVIAGTSPLVLVAPHGGRRDPVERPWAGGGMRMNDLHTAALTRELAAVTGAAALVNDALDRNDVDLNRITDAHDRAPWFLERLHDLVGAALARHGRCTLLTVHGWNVVQPAVDLGLGCIPGPDPFLPARTAAVSPAFAAAALPALVAACEARGISATVGARYPARARENLLQLFAARHRDDPRPLVRALVDLGPRVEAVQLELSLALRWPGPWREALRAACLAALPALSHPEAASPSVERPLRPAAASAPVPRRIQVTAPELSALAAIDRVGARLLLFPPAGGLLLYTGERTSADPPDAVGPLVLRRTSAGGLVLRCRGPMLRFDDTIPFLDLEAGLARAELVDAEVALDLDYEHATSEPADFARARGQIVLDGGALALDADAFVAVEEPGGPRPRLRGALRLGTGGALAVSLGLAGGDATGFLCRDGHHHPVVGGRARLGGDDAPLDRVRLDVELAGGERLGVELRAVHSLPVIRARGGTALRVEFAACRLAGGASPAGWLELV